MAAMGQNGSFHESAPYCSTCSGGIIKSPRVRKGAKVLGMPKLVG